MTRIQSIAHDAINPPVENNLPVGRNIKIGFFHLGSGMADVITTGVWNRIMISDLGFAATPIGLLVSLRYFLAPLGIWAGRISDRRAVAGYHRLFWVWLGRAMMASSMLTLGFQTSSLARGIDATPLTWLVLASSLLLFSLGNAISGSTFLALIYDRASTQQRGRAVGIVWTFLLLGFTIGGVLFGVLLTPDNVWQHRAFQIPRYVPAAWHVGLSYSPDTLQNLFIITALLLAGLWFFSLLGEERRAQTGSAPIPAAEAQTSIRADLALVWSSPPMRYFCWYLALSMTFAFSQDLILEPFAADVFKIDAAHTSRFSAYWGSMSILGTLMLLYLSRKFPRLTNSVMSRWGIYLLLATFGVFALSSLAQIRPLVTPGLVLLGLGLGVWNVGTLGLMMDMSPHGRAGTFLGFWTLVVTLSRGLGVSGGGIVRDVALSLTGDAALAYGVIFILGFFGLGASLWALMQINMADLASEQAVDSAQVFAGAMD